MTYAREEYIDDYQGSLNYHEHFELKLVHNEVKRFINKLRVIALGQDAMIQLELSDAVDALRDAEAYIELTLKGGD